MAATGHAQTSCDAANRFTLNWDDLTPKNTALGTGSRAFTVTNALGATVTLTMSFAGDTSRYVNSGFGQTPNISVQNVGGIAAGEYTLLLATTFAAYATDIGTNTNVTAVRFDFSVPVREVTFKLLDVDHASSGQFRDWVRVSGTNVATYVPAIATPYGRNNTSNPGVTPPGVSFVGPGTTAGATIVSGDVIGTASATSAQDFGNLDVQFAQPVTQTEIRYANGPASTMTGTPGQQSISVHDISFCPMPTVAIAKSASPVSVIITDPNRFNIPDADVDYTITVTNSGGSSVDLGTTLIGDVLPAQVAFYNGDIDVVTPGTQNFVFTAGTTGLTLGAANVTYLNSGGTPIAPGAGYDPLVRTVRWLPQGAMAANSSFSIRFRMRIN